MDFFNRIDPEEQKDRWMMQQNEDHTSFTHFDIEHYEKVQRKKKGIIDCYDCNDSGCSRCSPVSAINTLFIFLLCVSVASFLAILIYKTI